MASLAAHWVDRVLPEVGLRQWVVTVPWPRRWLLARRPDLARGVLAVAIRTLTRFLARRAAVRDHPKGQTGSVTVVQRFGSALNLNLHFHILCLDGVYVRGADGLRFVRARQVTTEEVGALVVELANCAERRLSRQGFGPEDAEEEHGDDDDALPLMQAASVRGRSAVAGGRRARRFQVHRGRAYALPPRCAAWGGYTLHGGVAIGGRDTGGRERLCRYLARPALARTRLQETPAGLIRVTFKRPWADGTAGDLTSAELLWRVFEVDGWRCPTCGGRMTLRAVPWPRATLRILDGLDAAAARAPPHAVAVSA